MIDSALVDRFRRLPPSTRALVLAGLGEAVSDIRYDWAGFWARPDQLVEPAEVERSSLIVFRGPRGSGKTRAAVELFNREILAGRARRPRIFAATESDVDKAVVHGVSGVMACLPRELRPVWMAQEGPAGVLRYPGGVEALCFTAHATEGAVSHAGDLDLYDDVAKWGPHAHTAWSHARLSCREGVSCGLVATTRRGTQLLKRLLEGSLDGVLVRRPNDPLANRANLNPKLFAHIAAEIEGLDAELGQELDDEDVADGGPFAELDFVSAPIRICEAGEIVELAICVDPSDGRGPRHDEWGIAAVGRRSDRHVVVLEDASGDHDDASAGAVVLALLDAWSRRFPRAAAGIVGEDNRGGERLKSALRAAHLQEEIHRLTTRGDARPRPMPAVSLVTTRDGKARRAGPVAALYRSGLLHHLGAHRALERQLRGWDTLGPKRPKQDDRIDAVLLGAHYLADLGRDAEGDSGETARATFAGLREAARTQPRPPFAGERV